MKLNLHIFLFIFFMLPILLFTESLSAFETVKTKIMRVTDKAQTVEVNLDGARDLYLAATYGDDNYDSDQTVWAEPVLEDSTGNVTDLTLIPPVSAETGWGNMLLNCDHKGDKIRVCGETFERGIFAHAPSVLHFQLDGKYVKFRARVGLVESASRGSASFEVHSEPVKMPAPEVFKRNFGGASAAPAFSVPLSKDAQFEFNPEAAKLLLERGIGEIVFIRRLTLNANHVYTDHVNSRWMPGGGLAVLNLRTGAVRDLAPQLASGVVHRFDVSFDARKIVFDFKRSELEGYRIYEINTDGTGLRQLTFPPEEEPELITKYHRGGYHHGTDDMQPCYLPDGGIAFISTRCQFSVLCDASDNFTVSNLYRMDADGKNMQPLTFSALNEQSPVMMADGRILYHRWEYLGKAAGNAKALWSVNPDGTNPSEVYGNSVTFPECMIYARQIPDTPDKIVMIGASHCCPNNAVGTVIIVDTKKNIRSSDAMTYLTKETASFHHNGFHFLNEKGEWIHDMSGVPGRLFKDPYPLGGGMFLASRKPKGLTWNDVKGYDLVILDADGTDTPLLKDTSVSCWHAFPLTVRTVPPVRPSVRDEVLAAENRAVAVMTDVYTGMDGVPRGSVKYLRILEQVPRSWSARKSWGQDHEGTTHAHSAVGDGHLSVKIQLGIVPVESDGSAKFYVPADRAVYLQALDAKYRAIQTERTYVNYRPGETRACVGCHETPSDTPSRSAGPMPHAMGRPVSVMECQPNQVKNVAEMESEAEVKSEAEMKTETGVKTASAAEPENPSEMTFNYDLQIQPLWERHCISCHGPEKAEAGLNLSAKPERTYCVSYNQLAALSRDPKKQLLGNRFYRNEDAAMNGIEYIPPYRTGALSSTLSGWLSGDGGALREPEHLAYVEYLRKTHPGISLSEEELLTLNNWLDVNCPYHPSYFGHLNAVFEGLPDFRPAVSPEEARSRTGYHPQTKN